MALTDANNEGKAAFKAGRYADAVAGFSRAHTENPGDAQVLGNRSAALAKLGRHEEALADARAAVSADRAYVKGYYRQASSLIELGRFEKAALAASAGLAIQPDNAQMAALKQDALKRAREQAGAMQAGGEEEVSEDGDDSGEEDSDALPSLEGEDEDEPMLSPEELAAQGRAQAEAYKASGNAHFKAGRWAAAVAQYKLAMQADPTNATYPLNRAAALLQEGKGKEALADATTALELDPTLIKAHLRACKALCQLGRFSDARRQLEGAAKLEGSAAALAPELASLSELEALLRNGKAALEREDKMAAREAAMHFSTLAEKCPASIDIACLQMQAILKSKPVAGAAQVLTDMPALNQTRPLSRQLQHACYPWGPALRRLDSVEQRSVEQGSKRNPLHALFPEPHT